MHVSVSYTDAFGNCDANMSVEVNLSSLILPGNYTEVVRIGGKGEKLKTQVVEI